MNDTLLEKASNNLKYREKAHEQQVRAFRKAHLTQKEPVVFFIKKLTEDNYLKENFTTVTGLFFEALSTVEEVMEELRDQTIRPTLLKFF